MKKEILFTIDSEAPLSCISSVHKRLMNGHPDITMTDIMNAKEIRKCNGINTFVIIKEAN